MSTRGFNSSLQKALAGIGRRNGHAPPTGGSNHDALLHYFMVDSVGKSFFEAQRKASQEEMLDALPVDAAERLDTLVAAAKDEERKQPTAALLDTGRYVLNLDVKKPAERIDTTRLRNQMMRDGKYSPAEVDALFDKCTKQNEPAKAFTVAALYD